MANGRLNSKCCGRGFSCVGLRNSVVFGLGTLFNNCGSRHMCRLVPCLKTNFARTCAEPRMGTLAVGTNLVGHFHVSDTISVGLRLDTAKMRNGFSNRRNNGRSCSNVFKTSVNLACHFPGHKFRHPFPRVVSRLRLEGVHRRVGTVTTTGLALRRRLRRTRDRPAARIMRRRIVMSTGVTPHAMFFGVNSTRVSPHRTVGLSCLTRRVGGFPSAGCIMGKCTSSTANAPDFGGRLDVGHTRTIIGMLIGRCNVSTGHLDISNGNNMSGFKRPVLGHIMLIGSGGWGSEVVWGEGPHCQFANDKMFSWAVLSIYLFLEDARLLCLFHCRVHVIGMVSLRESTGIYRYVNDNNSYRFTSLFRRLVSNESVFLGLFPTIASQLRYLLRGNVWRTFCFRVSRSAALVINFRLVRIQVVQRVALRVFQAARYVGVYRCDIAFCLAQILCARVIKVNRRTRCLFLCFINAFKRMSAVAR